jgi:hypothetical protein
MNIWKRGITKKGAAVREKRYFISDWRELKNGDNKK